MVPEFFRRRYGRRNSLVMTLILILPMAGFTAVQSIASATILNVMTGWDYATSVAVVTLVTVVYSVKGGMFAFVPALIGLLLTGMVNNGSIDAELLLSQGANYSLPVMALNVLPSAVTGILFATLISATMSSASSDLLAAGSLFSNDIYKVYINKDASDARMLKVTKLVMLLVGVVSFLVAVMNVTDIITLLIFSFSLRAAGGFFPYVFGHLWEKASVAGCMASLVLGSLALIVVELKLLPFFDLDPLYAGLAVSAVCFFGISLLTHRQAEKRGLSMIKEVE
ncbi:hypothetical protein H0A71_22370 [Alcaligenaceae bacterium]|nr:hypothetical protein [Alcaligenaceae bacterium]